MDCKPIIAFSLASMKVELWHQQNKNDILLVLYFIPFLLCLFFSARNLIDVTLGAFCKLLIFLLADMTFPGILQNIYHFMVVLITMTTITMLGDKVIATLLQSSPTVITFMEQTRLLYSDFL